MHQIFENLPHARPGSGLKWKGAQSSCPLGVHRIVLGIGNKVPLSLIFLTVRMEQTLLRAQGVCEVYVKEQCESHQQVPRRVSEPQWFSRAACSLWFSVQELPFFQFKFHVDGGSTLCLGCSRL